MQAFVMELNDDVAEADNRPDQIVVLDRDANNNCIVIRDGVLGTATLADLVAMANDYESDLV